jgi:hypothetical protein
MLEQKVVEQSTKVVNYKQSKIKVMRVGLFPFAMNLLSFASQKKTKIKVGYSWQQLLGGQCRVASCLPLICWIGMERKTMESQRLT